MSSADQLSKEWPQPMPHSAGVMAGAASAAACTAMLRWLALARIQLTSFVLGLKVYRCLKNSFLSVFVVYDVIVGFPDIFLFGKELAFAMVPAHQRFKNRLFRSAILFAD